MGEKMGVQGFNSNQPLPGWGESITQRCCPAWHLVNEGSRRVLRERPPTSQTPQPRAQPTRELASSQNSDPAWPKLAVGRAPSGQPGRAGCPAEPRMGLTPRLGQDTPSLAEAQLGSVYRICEPCSPPPPSTSPPPGVWGGWARGRRGPKESLGG